MTDQPKICAQCKHAYQAVRGTKPYWHCALAKADKTHDDALAQNMRLGDCGPEATLWEAKDGA